MSLLDIPIEVMRDEVFSYLDLKTLMAFCSTSSMYRGQVDNFLWYYLATRDFQHKGKYKNDVGYDQQYQFLKIINDPETIDLSSYVRNYI